MALELQSDLDALARALTQRCGLDARVAHVCGDILAAPPPGAPFDHAVSFLCFLHIRDRERLANRLQQSLKPGATLYVEDYIAHRPLRADEQEALRVKVQCPFVPTTEAYCRTLGKQGSRSWRRPI